MRAADKTKKQKSQILANHTKNLKYDHSREE